MLMKMHYKTRLCNLPCPSFVSMHNLPVIFETALHSSHHPWYLLFTSFLISTNTPKAFNSPLIVHDIITKQTHLINNNISLIQTSYTKKISGRPRYLFDFVTKQLFRFRPSLQTPCHSRYRMICYSNDPCRTCRRAHRLTAFP
jgi:hypothetical protein